MNSMTSQNLQKKNENRENVTENYAGSRVGKKKKLR